MWEEIMKIIVVIIGAVFNAEVLEKPGSEKYAAAKNEVMKEVKDPGGIHVTNKWVLMGLDYIIPPILNFIVWKINKLGLFTSLKEK